MFSDKLNRAISPDPGTKYGGRFICWHRNNGIRLIEITIVHTKTLNLLNPQLNVIFGSANYRTLSINWKFPVFIIRINCPSSANTKQWTFYFYSLVNTTTMYITEFHSNAERTHQFHTLLHNILLFSFFYISNTASWLADFFFLRYFVVYNFGTFKSFVFSPIISCNNSLFSSQVCGWS